MSTHGGVLCSGSIVYDTLARPVDETHWGTTSVVDSIEFHIGGNGANTLIALARIGIRVRLLGAIGNDDRGQFVLNMLRGAGVDTDAVEIVDAPTAATVVIVNRAGDRKFLHCLGASGVAFAQPIDLGSTLKGLGHYHLASLFLMPLLRAHAPQILERARRAGVTTSLDTNWEVN